MADKKGSDSDEEEINLDDVPPAPQLARQWSGGSDGRNLEHVI